MNGPDPERSTSLVCDATHALRPERALEILELAHDGVVCTDLAGTIVFFNAGAERVFGHAADEVIGAPLELLIPHRFAADHATHVARFVGARAAAKPMGSRGLITGLRADGTEFPARASIARSGEGDECVLSVVLTDVSGEQALTRRLEESSRFNESVMNSVSGYITVVDAAGNITMTNRTARAALEANGTEAAAVIGRPYVAFASAIGVGEAHLEQLASSLAAMISGTQDRFEIDVSAALGPAATWLHVVAGPLEPGGTGFILSHRDVSVRKVLERELAARATTDQLTGLASRDLLHGRIEEWSRNGPHDRPIAILFVDIDDFKSVNDRFGHAAGDELLRAIARRITQIQRPEDTAARFGGDEFVILCRELSSVDDAATIAGRVAEAVAGPFDVGGDAIEVSASIGVAVVDAQQPATAEQVLQRSDAAMYRAKRRGKSRIVFFEPNLGAKVPTVAGSRAAPLS